MTKRTLTAILCVILLFCFVACGEDGGTKTYDTLFDTYPSVFVTENITCITFYAYYGNGKGSEVPSEHMTEIINWLDSFTIDSVATDEDVLDGTNTRHVEIEYANGTIIKEGLDLIVVDGTSYSIKGDKAPDCFAEIISKTSLE